MQLPTYFILQAAFGISAFPRREIFRKDLMGSSEYLKREFPLESAALSRELRLMQANMPAALAFRGTSPPNIMLALCKGGEPKHDSR